MALKVLSILLSIQRPFHMVFFYLANVWLLESGFSCSVSTCFHNFIFTIFVSYRKMYNCCWPQFNDVWELEQRCVPAAREVTRNCRITMHWVEKSNYYLRKNSGIIVECMRSIWELFRCWHFVHSSFCLYWSRWADKSQKDHCSQH
jgi:hypothetical protein